MPSADTESVGDTSTAKLAWCKVQVDTNLYHLDDEETFQWFNQRRQECQRAGRLNHTLHPSPLFTGQIVCISDGLKISFLAFHHVNIVYLNTDLNNFHLQS